MGNKNQGGRALKAAAEKLELPLAGSEEPWKDLERKSVSDGTWVPIGCGRDKGKELKTGVY